MTHPVTHRTDPACVCVVQLVICIPVPDITVGGKAKRGAPAENIELNERLADEHEDETLDDMGRRGHILWIRGLTRLQTQVTLSSLHSTSSPTVAARCVFIATATVMHILVHRHGVTAVAIPCYLAIRRLRGLLPAVGL